MYLWYCDTCLKWKSDIHVWLYCQKGDGFPRYIKAIKNPLSKLTCASALLGLINAFWSLWTKQSKSHSLHDFWVRDAVMTTIKSIRQRKFHAYKSKDRALALS